MCLPVSCVFAEIHNMQIDLFIKQTVTKVVNIKIAPILRVQLYGICNLLK